MGTPNCLRTGTTCRIDWRNSGSDSKSKCPIRPDSVHAFDADLDVHSERGQHVGRAAAAGDRPIAVLGHGHARGGRYQGSGSADVECARTVAAGPAGVQHTRRVGCGWGSYAASAVAAAPATSATVSPLCAECREQDRDFAIAAAALHDHVDRGRHFLEGQILPGRQAAQSRFDHALAPFFASVRKFRPGGRWQTRYFACPPASTSRQACSRRKTSPQPSRLQGRVMLGRCGSRIGRTAILGMRRILSFSGGNNSSF